MLPTTVARETGSCRQERLPFVKGCGVAATLTTHRPSQKANGQDHSSVNIWYVPSGNRNSSIYISLRTAWHPPFQKYCVSLCVLGPWQTINVTCTITHTVAICMMSCIRNSTNNIMMRIVEHMHLYEQSWTQLHALYDPCAQPQAADFHEEYPG